MSPPLKINFTDNLPTNLPRPSGLRLSIELIPGTTAGLNLRSQLTPKQWDILRHRVYARANYHCEACGEGDIEIHCHEVWDFDDYKHMQKLIGLRSLCWKCHEVTHLTQSGFTSQLEVLSHLARVNNITIFKANKILLKAYAQWSERNRHEWIIDTSWLDSYLQKEEGNEPG